MRKIPSKLTSLNLSFVFKATLSFCTFFIICLNGHAQWQWLNPKPSGFANTRIVFTSHTTGYILNSNGDLFKTTDIGESWAQINNFPGNPLCMDIKDSTGVIGCIGGILYLTNDNGNTWQYVNTGLKDVFETINIVSRDTFFLSNGYSGGGNIYKTTDRGRTWTTLRCNIPIHSIVFTDSKTGFVGSSQGIIIKTEDGGNTWERKRAVSYIPSGIQAMQFISKDTGYAFQEYDSLLTTYDGGNTWRSSNAYFTMSVINFINSTDGYLGGRDGVIVATHDGGKTFESAGFGGLVDGNTINSLCFLSKDTGFSVGMLGRIMKTTDAGKNWIPYSPTYLPITGLTFVDSVNGYAMTSRKIYKTSDKWKTWKELGLKTGIQYPSQSDFEQFNFLSPDTGFVTTSFPARIHHTFDGGITWDTVSIISGDFNQVSDLQFLDNKTGFMLLVASNGGVTGYIVKTKDGGLTWNIAGTPSDIVNNFRHIHYVNEDTAYANTYNQLYKTTDGGKTWASVFTTQYYYQLTNFDFTSVNKGFVTDGNGDIVSTNDGGLTWTNLRLSDFTDIVNGEIGAIKFYNRQIGYLTTRQSFGPVNHGDIYQTIDSGLTWNKIKNIGGNNILFTQDTSVVISGYGGTVVSAKIRSANVDSIKQLNNCSDVLSSVVTVVLSRVDSISFEITDRSGQTVSVRASPISVENERGHCTASVNFLKNDSSYSVRVKYLYEGRYVLSAAVNLKPTGLSRPTINKSGNVLSSSYSNGNQWYRNDTLINGATQQTYILPEILYKQCYRVMVSNNSGCSSSSDTICINSGPKTSLKISGVYTSSGVSLTWTTGTELNISHFEIEKSSNGTDYVSIDSMPSSGNGSAFKNYSYSDKVVRQPNSVNYYYRVKEIYANGSFTYSNIVTVKIPPNINQLAAAPNPTRGNAVIYFPSTFTNAVIGIYDQFGRKVFADKFDTPHDNYPLNLTGFKAGIYSIRINCDKGIFEGKIVVIK